MQHLRPRPHEKNPRGSHCALALRRVCGVCAHFDGPGLRAAGVCVRLQAQTQGPRRADACPDWTRRTQPHSAPPRVAPSSPAPVTEAEIAPALAQIRPAFARMVRAVMAEPGIGIAGLAVRLDIAKSTAEAVACKTHAALVPLGFALRGVRWQGYRVLRASEVQP